MTACRERAAAVISPDHRYGTCGCGYFGPLTLHGWLYPHESRGGAA